MLTPSRARKNHRRYPNERGPRPDLAALRRSEAEDRCKARQLFLDHTPPAEQLAHLDLKFGKEQGAAKERAKLQKLLSPQKDSNVKSE